MKIKPILWRSFAILIVLIILLDITVYMFLKASLPENEGDICISGVESKVEILFDGKGIPQIWAENENDAWFAVGWLHAGDRLFQMELTRRVANGRLSELFGEITLTFDRQQRMIGHAIMAEKDLQNLSQASNEMLQSYVSGINQWVKNTAVLPFEFYLLGNDFEPWTVKDCLSLFSFQTWYSNDLQNNDKFLISLEELIGKQKTDQLIIPYPGEAPTTVPQGQTYRKRIDSTNKYSAYTSDWHHFFYQYLFNEGEIPFLLTEGSNAWVISGGKSKSGKAILANDPHLDLSRLPQFWYALGVHTLDGSLNVLGITTPGVPYIVMGHNGKSAWAFTAAAVDITDEYTERLNPEDSDEYLVGNHFRRLETREEVIEVKGWNVKDTVLIKSTRHGPVISENDEKNERYTLRWAGFDFSLSQAVASASNLSRVSNYQEFRQIVTGFAALDANWIYADSEGNIGYQLGTPIPIRPPGQSNARLPGWDNQHEWSGYYPLDRTPHAYNPKQGWLASCNNLPDDHLDYSLPGNFADNRIYQISNLLSSKEIFSPEDMKMYQQDLKSIQLLRWKNEAISVLNEIDEGDWIEILRQWEGSTDLDSRATALTETWLALLKQYTFEDDFKDLVNNFHSRINYRDRNFESLYFSGDSKWFDDLSTENQTENRHDMALKAMREALVKVNNKRWGDIQSLTMTHPMAVVPILSTFLSLQKGPFPRAGTTGSLNNSTAFWDEAGEFICKGGPSWRFIIDFDDIDDVQVVLPAGQSGHPLSPHFFDFYKLWEKGDYWVLPFSKEEVEKQAVSKLKLIPITSM